MRMFQNFDIAASGMKAEQFRMDVISNNIANAHTLKTEDGNPYRRQVANVSAAQIQSFEREFATASFNDSDFDFDISSKGATYQGSGVSVEGVTEDSKDFNYVYDPSHPDAIKEGPRKGYVAKPNVNMLQEMTMMMEARRSYEANATSIETAKAMAMKALEIGR